MSERVHVTPISVTRSTVAPAPAAHGSTEAANLQLFARSLAHDFNNLITGILGHAEYIEAIAPPDAEDLIESAITIRKTAERAAELNEQLMNLARLGASRALPVDLHATLREVASLVHCSLPPGTSLELTLDAPHCTITGDPGQLHQAFLNLAVNARDAMPAPGGRLIFSTGCTAGTVSVTVADNGCGIPAEIQGRIFEPLFTTKGEGRGSGIGLAVVKRVVEQHSGMIAVQSAPGQGTRFELVFPLRERAEAAAAGLQALSAAAASA
ncbi:MAG: HAMP domain-containing histidine kinase [Bryobacterales bacterium]|nr:HAMP domain-containing histidine kinase [Bryobacterales bacterium]